MSRSIRVADRWRDVLFFLKGHSTVYHASNVFFRDLQFGVQRYLEKQGVRVSNAGAERMAAELAERLEKEKVLKRLDRQTWVVDRPEFKKEPVAPAQKPAPAKPAPPAGSAAPAAAASGAPSPASPAA